MHITHRTNSQNSYVHDMDNESGRHQFAAKVQFNTMFSDTVKQWQNLLKGMMSKHIVNVDWPISDSLREHLAYYQ